MDPDKVQIGHDHHWAIDIEFRKKYARRFMYLDTERRRYLNGRQAYYSFTMWGLPCKTMAKIWSLADIDENERLVCEEFILAMYLCQFIKQGGKIPTQLDVNLIPPLFRQDNENDILYYCDEQRESEVDREYIAYVAKQSDDFKKFRICTLCMELQQYTSFTRHTQNKHNCKPFKQEHPKYCPYCPIKENQMEKRTDQISNHMWTQHKIGNEPATTKNTKKRARCVAILKETASKQKRIEPNMVKEMVKETIVKENRSLNDRLDEASVKNKELLEAEQQRWKRKFAKARRDSKAISEKYLQLKKKIEEDKSKYLEKIGALELELKKVKKSNVDLIEQSRKLQSENEKSNKKNDATLKAEKLKHLETIGAFESELNKAKKANGNLIEQLQKLQSENENLKKPKIDDSVTVKNLIPHIKSNYDENVPNNLNKLLEQLEPFLDAKLHIKLQIRCCTVLAELTKDKDDLRSMHYLIKALMLHRDDTVLEQFNQLKTNLRDLRLENRIDPEKWLRYSWLIIGLPQTSTNAKIANFMDIYSRDRHKSNVAPKEKKKSKTMQIYELFTEVEMNDAFTAIKKARLKL